MPIVPSLASIILEARAHCPACHEPALLPGLLPIAERDLELFPPLAAEISGQLPFCPRCGQTMVLDELVYHFDEPDLPPLCWRQSGLWIEDDPVTSEEGLIARIGRPLAPASLHRAELARAIDEGRARAWSAGPGLVSAAISGLPEITGEEPDDLEQWQQTIAEQMNELLSAASELLGPGGPGARLVPLAWTRDPAMLTWAGPAAREIVSGRAMALNLVRLDLLEEAIAAQDPALPELGGHWLPSEQGICLLWPGGRLRIDLERAAELTISGPLTIAEAASQASWEVCQLAGQIDAVMSYLPEEIRRQSQIDDRGLIKIKGGKTPLEARLPNLLMRLNSAEEVARRLTAMFHYGKDPHRLPCGCRGAWGVQLRFQLDEDNKLISRDASFLAPGLRIYLARDCPHQTAYISAGDLDENELAQAWQEADRGEQRFDFAYYRLPQTSAYALLGDNVATVALRHDWMRQVARQLKIQADELRLISATGSIALLLFRRGHQSWPDNISINEALAEVAQAAAHERAWGLAQEIAVDEICSGRGQRNGEMHLTELPPQHPLVALIRSSPSLGRG